MLDPLSPRDIDHFIESGFVKIENAFPQDVAEQCCDILWKDAGCDPDDPTTWTKPVIRLGEYAQEPFRIAANTEKLQGAYSQLVGKGRWFPRGSLGTFPIRFPSKADPGDAGWHADAGFYANDGTMRSNIHSRGRMLLMLFLFTDTEINDAPTRILTGSHLDVPRILEPYGEDGLSFIELAQLLPESTLSRDIVYATGRAGTVYLCHPFLIHGAQSHHGTRPRILAQPPLMPRSDESIRIHRENNDYSPVEIATRRGLSLE